jgi:hypothetical protein
MIGSNDFSGLFEHGSIGDVEPLDILPIDISLRDREQAIAALRYIDEHQLTKAIIEKYFGMVRGRKYPLYGFFLYSIKDKEIAEFIRVDGHWINSLSGFDCLIGEFFKWV